MCQCPTMDLKSYLEALGDRRASAELGVAKRTIRAYRAGVRRPSPEVAARIVAGSEGRVSYADIYEPAEA